MNKLFLCSIVLSFSSGLLYAGNFSRQSTEELKKLSPNRRIIVGNQESSIVAQLCCNPRFAKTKLFEVDGDVVKYCGDVSNLSRKQFDMIASGNFVYHPDLYPEEYKAYLIYVGVLLVGTRDPHLAQRIVNFPVQPKIPMSRSY